MAILCFSCITSKGIERLKKTSVNIPVQDMKDQQIEDKDSYTHLGFSIPVLGGGEWMKNSDFLQPGAELSHVRNHFCSIQSNFSYNVKDWTKNYSPIDNKPQHIQKLSQLDFSVETQIPFLQLISKNKEKIVLIEDASDDNSFSYITPQIKFNTFLQAHLGFQADFNSQNVENVEFAKQFNIASKNIFVNQRTNNLNVGLSWNKRSNYKYHIWTSKKEFIGKYLTSASGFAKMKMLLNLELPTMELNQTYWENTQQVLVIYRADPKQFLQLNRIGYEFGYRIQVAGLKRSIQTFEFASGMYTGYSGDPKDLLYVRAVWYIGFGVFSPKYK